MNGQKPAQGHYIKSKIAGLASRKARNENFGCARDTRTLRGRDRLEGRGRSSARFHFYKSDHAASPGDNVDLADAQPALSGQAALEDPPAAQAQAPDAQGFGETPMPLGSDTRVPSGIISSG
jgi:hypothetical protein